MCDFTLGSTWTVTYSTGKIMVALPFYKVLYGINYRLPNITYIIAVGIYSVV